MRWLVMGCAMLAACPAFAADQWVVRTDRWGNSLSQSLLIEPGATQGTLDGAPARVTRKGKTIQIESDDARLEGRIDGAAIRGTATLPDTQDGTRRVRHAFTARRIASADGPPRTHRYTPTDFSNLFSADRAPVLVIRSGDTVQTETIDSGGVDSAGKTRALYGNPQTGPFFVAGAEAGDTLAIRIDALAPNRDWADSLDMLVGRAQTRATAARAGDLGKPVRWTLDRARGIARPEGRLSGYEIPLKPMLGGIALAPPFGFASPSTGDTGRFGGNMDFNEIGAGATVYLPVEQPGGLLYIGDAHAAQGDGETSQFALETSMDVTFTATLLKKSRIATPRVETATHYWAIGQSGTAEDAIKIATAGLTQWLEQRYGLSLSDAAVILGSAAEYRVATLAGQNVGMVAGIAKARLAGLVARDPR